MTSRAIEPFAWSIAGFCERFNVGRSTVYAEIKRGEIAVNNVGDRTLITDQEGRRWLSTKEVRKGKPAEPVEG
jgi:predicted DNA-binding protein YlxM (UPF0122 family)